MRVRNCLFRMMKGDEFSFRRRLVFDLREAQPPWLYKGELCRLMVPYFHNIKRLAESGSHL